MNEAAVYKLIEKAHPAPAWACLPTVRNATGYSRSRTRTADALAMSLWPSRGLELHGFEVKCARSDWRRELLDPEKAEDIARFCDRWWLVGTDEKCIPIEEVPPAWGLYVVEGGKLVQRKPAEKREAQALDRGFVAAILRAAAAGHAAVLGDMVPRASIQDEINAAREAGIEAGQKARATAADYELAELRNFKQGVEDFERQLGVKLGTWQARQAAIRVRQALCERSIEEGWEQLRIAAQRLQKASADVDRLLTPLSDGPT